MKQKRSRTLRRRKHKGCRNHNNWIQGGDNIEQDKLLKVDNTIEKLCDFLQKETERVASIYESQELTEMTKALAELMSARAKFD